MVETDIKKVLAYSSISQLGFMLMALAGGGLFAGIFHLITHAIFKALLFLCAGSYIHHTGSNEMEVIGAKGGRKMKFTTTGLIIGALGLSGVPPLAGFFSKEEIFGALTHHHHYVFLAGAYVSAMLTAYYTFRMVFLVTRPRAVEAPTHDEHHHDDGHHHASDSPATMTGPILLLSAMTLVFGFLGGRIAHALELEIAHHTFLAMLPAVGIVVLGIAVAWFDYGRAAAARTGFISHTGPLYTLFRNKWYIDDFYRAIFVRITDAMATAMATLETRGFDDTFDAVADGVGVVGEQTARVQCGWVQVYIGSFVVMLAAFAIYLGLH
jgi:NADH-quinone oxidoreductase subunit L